MLYVIALDVKMEMPWGCRNSHSLPAQQGGSLGMELALPAPCLILPSLTRDAGSNPSSGFPSWKELEQMLKLPSLQWDGMPKVGAGAGEHLSQGPLDHW